MSPVSSFRAVALAALTTLAAGVSSAQDKSISIMVWGTTWQSSLQSLSKEFTQQTGIRVNLVTQASSGEGLVKLQNMKAKPTVDVWFTTASVAERAVSDASLFSPLPADKMPNLANVVDGAATSHYAAVYGYPMSIVYRTDLIKTPITQWAELWTREDITKKLSIPGMSMYQGRALMMASMAHGGTSTDDAKGFEMLAKLKPQIAMFYSSDAQARTAISQGEIAVMMATPAAGKRVSDGGHPVKVISPKPAVMNYDVMTLVKSGKEDLAAQYVNFLLERSVNERVSALTNMAPVVKNAKIPASLAQQLPAPEDAVTLDEKWVNSKITGWVERFNKEVAN